MAIEIVDCSINSMVDLSIAMWKFTRGYFSLGRNQHSLAAWAPPCCISLPMISTSSKWEIRKMTPQWKYQYSWGIWCCNNGIWMLIIHQPEKNGKIGWLPHYMMPSWRPYLPRQDFGAPILTVLMEKSQFITIYPHYHPSKNLSCKLY